MLNASSATLRAVLAMFTVATVLIACDKQSVAPTESTSSARVLADSTSADSTGTAGSDSTCHRADHMDSTGHHRPDSSDHHKPPHGHWPDSSRVKPPLDSARHDSTRHERRPSH